VYVYGIVPGDVKLNSGVHGVGDPPGEIRLVRSGDLAALVSEVDITKPLGTPDDLQAHQEILDATVIDAPVLPSRFGAVLTNEEAVAAELLDANHDEFAAALRQLEGRVEYIVRGRYAEQALLEEILSENSRAARLRDRISGADPDATRELRIQLGEIVNNAVANKRQNDTRDLLRRDEGSLRGQSGPDRDERDGRRLRRRLPHRGGPGRRARASCPGPQRPLARAGGAARPRADGALRFRGQRRLT